jgi:hypothetical protein
MCTQCFHSYPTILLKIKNIVLMFYNIIFANNINNIVDNIDFVNYIAFGGKTITMSTQFFHSYPTILLKLKNIVLMFYNII